MDDYIKDIIFKNNCDRYEELVELNSDIQKLSIKKRPYLIEFLGSARSGKSTTIELIADVFRKNGLKVSVVDEETVKLTKTINENRNQIMQVNSLDYTNNVIEEKVVLYDSYNEFDADIVIFDRGINDEFIWLYTFGASSEKLEEYHNKLKDRYVDTLILLTCDIEVSLKRKYFNSLSVLPNKWTNPETLSKYLEGLKKVSNYFENHAVSKCYIDSTQEEKIKIAIQVCRQIIEDISAKQ